MLVHVYTMLWTVHGKQALGGDKGLRLDGIDLHVPR